MSLASSDAPSALSPPARRHLASSARWAWLLVAINVVYFANMVPQMWRVLRIGQGLPLGARLLPLLAAVPGTSLCLAVLVLAVSYARGARAVARGRDRDLAVAARSLRHLWAVLFVVALLMLVAGALATLGRARLDWI